MKGSGEESVIVMALLPAVRASCSATGLMTCAVRTATAMNDAMPPIVVGLLQSVPPQPFSHLHRHGGFVVVVDTLPCPLQCSTAVHFLY